MTESVSLIDRAAEAMEKDGVDAHSFREHVPGLVDHFEQDKREKLISALAAVCRDLHAREMSPWSLLYFSLPPAAEACAHAARPFAEIITAFKDLIPLLDDPAVNGTIFLQRGFPGTARAAGGRPERMLSALAFAKRLAGKKQDPTSLLEAALPMVIRVAGNDDAAFERLLSGLESLSQTMDDRGQSATIPIAHGIAALENLGDATVVAEGIRRLEELAVLLSAAGIVPHPVFEHGIVPALHTAYRFVGEAALPLAIRCTEAGHAPHALLNGLAAIGAADIEPAQQALAFAETAVEKGLDPGRVLAPNLGPLAAFAHRHKIPLPELFDLFLTFLKEFDDAGVNPEYSLLHGLIGFLDAERITPKDLRRVVQSAVNMARRGENPGPFWEQGLAPALGAFSDRPRTHATILTLAEQMTASGINPRDFFYHGARILHRVGGRDEDVGRRFERLGELAMEIASKGESAGDLFRKGLWSFPLHDADESLFDTLINELQNVMQVFRDSNLDPWKFLGESLPAWAESVKTDAAVFLTGMTFAVELAREKIPSYDLVGHAFPAMVKRGLARFEDEPALLDMIRDASRALYASGVDTAESVGRLLSAWVVAWPDWPTRLRTLLDVLVAEARLKRDASAALGYSAPVLFHSVPLAEFPQTLALLSDRFSTLLPAMSTAFWSWALPNAARGFGGEAGAAAAALDFAVNASQRRPSSYSEEAVFQNGWGAVAALANGRSDVFRSNVEAMEAALSEGEPETWARILEHAAYRAASQCKDDPQLFRDVLVSAYDLLTGWTATHRPSNPLLIQQLDLVDLFSGGSADGARKCARDFQRIHREKGFARNEEALFYALFEIRGLVNKAPRVWFDLIFPALVSHKQHVFPLLLRLSWLQKFVDGEEAVSLLQWIVTQEGVRAVSLLGDFLYAAAAERQIESLSAEKDIIIRFIQEIPFATGLHYQTYKGWQNSGLSLAERKARTAALRSSIEERVRSIRVGDVSEDTAREADFGVTLSYLFPPAASVGADSYLRLYSRLADHAEHVASWLKRGPIEKTEYPISLGSYQKKDDVVIDLSAWTVLSELLNEPPGDSVTAAELGHNAFTAWLNNQFSEPATRRLLANRCYALYRQSHPPLPELREEAEALLKHREFFSDVVKEILQDAVLAYRETDPDRFDRQASAKLSPPIGIGKGLRKSIANTAAAHRAGRITRDVAAGRLRSQLSGYELDEAALSTLLSLEEEGLASLLESLPAKLALFSPTDVSKRILGDLFGREMGVMQKELFGDGINPGKIEYRTGVGGPSLPLRFEITKRRAHAVIGYCEGVCTTSDEDLWNKPNFLQVIIWGAGPQAQGGIHFLIVKEKDKEYLSLPGINPSLDLLRQIGPAAFLNAAFSFAKHVASQWNLAGVWVPADAGILSNRGPIRESPVWDALSTRDVSNHAFSYSPYSYSFSRVFEVK